jgi:hypothetical protein
MALSIGYVSAVALSLRAAAGRHRSLRDRLVWSGMAALLLALLVNQQGDLHSRALRAGSDLLESQGIPVQSPAILAISAAVLMGAAAVTALVVAGTVRRGWPPGTMAILGLMIIAVHGLVRGARFLHVTPGTLVEGPLRGDLQWLEAAGLVLVIVGIHRFSRNPDAGAGSGVPRTLSQSRGHLG